MAKSTNPTPEVIEASREPMLYFPHDTDAAHDPKCVRLILRRGMEGYGQWWRLCELLGEAYDHKIAVLTDEDRTVLARELACGDLDAFLSDLADLDLVVPDLLEEGYVASERMHQNSFYFGKQKVSGAKGGKSRWKSQKKEGK